MNSRHIMAFVSGIKCIRNGCNEVNKHRETNWVIHLACLVEAINVLPHMKF